MNPLRPEVSRTIPVIWAGASVVLWVVFGLFEGTAGRHKAPLVLTAAGGFVLLGIILGLWLFSARQVNPPTQNEIVYSSMGMNQPSFRGSADLWGAITQVLFVWIFNVPTGIQQRARWWTLATTLGWAAVVVASFAFSGLLAILAATRVPLFLPWIVLGLSFGLLTGGALLWFFGKSTPR